MYLAIKKGYKWQYILRIKKSQNTQVVHKNLHILGSLVLSLIVLKLPVTLSVILHKLIIFMFN
ncbi:hypothetical protein J2S19_004026 [Metabacillus malikii]|uniref:Uncharacterized protein n=1 Tax=Metabacillus malikii TaxID=1504265 RepID=A0ABT9ZK85_9BACI|nr:hypothetical protein [Metabacillus malikii]